MIIARGQMFKITASRFVNVSEEELNLMKENVIPRNTKHITKFGMTHFKGKMWSKKNCENSAKRKGWFSLAHKHNISITSENTRDISVSISRNIRRTNPLICLMVFSLAHKHKHMRKSISISARKTNMFVFLALMLILMCEWSWFSLAHKHKHKHKHKQVRTPAT